MLVDVVVVDVVVVDVVAPWSGSVVVLVSGGALVDVVGSGAVGIVVVLVSSGGATVVVVEVSADWLVGGVDGGEVVAGLVRPGKPIVMSNACTSGAARAADSETLNEMTAVAAIAEKVRGSRLRGAVMRLPLEVPTSR